MLALGQILHKSLSNSCITHPVPGMSIVIYCLIQNSVQSQLKSGGWHQEVQPLRLFVQDLLKDRLIATNLLLPFLHCFLFQSMSLCFSHPTSWISDVQWLQNLQSSQCQSFCCPMREGTDWQEVPIGRGEVDGGYSAAEADLSWIWPKEDPRFQLV